MPLPAGKMMAFQTQTCLGRIPHARSSQRPGCCAPSVSCSSVARRWRSMPAPVGSRQEPWTLSCGPGLNRTGQDSCNLGSSSCPASICACEHHTHHQATGAQEACHSHCGLYAYLGASTLVTAGMDLALVCSLLIQGEKQILLSSSRHVQASLDCAAPGFEGNGCLRLSWGMSWNLDFCFSQARGCCSKSLGSIPQEQ